MAATFGGKGLESLMGRRGAVSTQASSLSVRNVAHASSWTEQSTLVSALNMIFRCLLKNTHRREEI